MKTVTRVLAIVLVFAFVLSIGAFAADTKTLNKKATVTKGTVKIDGKGTDKAWAKAVKIPITAQVIDYVKKDYLWTDKSKSAKIEYCKLLWDTNYLYVLIKVNDKTPNNPFTGYGDNVEYHIAAKNNMGTQYKKIEDAQYRLDRKGKISGWGDFDRTAFSKAAKCISTSTSYTQEIGIKWSIHGVSKAKAGMKVGFDIQVSDNADGKDRRYQIVWSSIDLAWTDPSTMGRITLK